MPDTKLGATKRRSGVCEAFLSCRNSNTNSFVILPNVQVPYRLTQPSSLLVSLILSSHHHHHNHHHSHMPIVWRADHMHALLHWNILSTVTDNSRPRMWLRSHPWTVVSNLLRMRAKSREKMFAGHATNNMYFFTYASLTVNTLSSIVCFLE